MSKPLCAKALCVGVTPDYRPDSSSHFWGLIPYGIPQVVAGDVLPRHHRGWRLLAGAPLSVLRACWLMALARSLPPVATTRTGADLCTTGSKKKRELNLFKARSADAISMSLLVPLLEFNQVCEKDRTGTAIILNCRSISFPRGATIEFWRVP